MNNLSILPMSVKEERKKERISWERWIVNTILNLPSIDLTLNEVDIFINK